MPFTIPNEVSGGRAEGQRQAGSFGGNQASNAHGTAMGRREAYGARVYVCLTGDRGRCRNAGEDDPLLGLARLIRRLGEIRGASRRRRGHMRVKAGSASVVPNRLHSSAWSHWAEFSGVHSYLKGGPLIDTRVP